MTDVSNRHLANRENDALDEPGPYPLDEPDTSLGELAGRLTSDMGALITDHLELARVEMVADLKQAARGAGLMGGGAVAAWLAALLLSLAAAWGLAEALDSTWLAFLIVGAIWAVVAAVMAAIGKQQLDQVDPVPDQTMEELERDKRWLKEQTN